MAPLRMRVLWKRLASTVMVVTAGAVISFCFADEEEHGDCRNTSVSCLLWFFLSRMNSDHWPSESEVEGQVLEGGQG